MALSETGAVVDPASLRLQFRTIVREEAERGREGFLMEPVFRRLATTFHTGIDIGHIGMLFRELSLKELRSCVTPCSPRCVDPE